MANVDPEARAVDEQVDRVVRAQPADLEGPKFLTAPGEGGVIRDRQVQALVHGS